MQSSDGFTRKFNAQDGKVHGAVSPGEATLCLATVFAKSVVTVGPVKCECMVPPLLAELELLQVGLISLFARWHL